MNDEIKSWYLIYTKPQQERMAEENLDRQGYEVYLPFIEVRRRRGMQYKIITEPLFPRYLFIYLSNRTDNWGPIRSTYGVTSLVRFGGLPAKVPDFLIDTLQASEEKRTISGAPTPEFKPGTIVRIVEGALLGYEAIVESKNSEQRVNLLLDLSGKYTKIKVTPNMIEKA